ncbi:hypothetical protein LCGC14_2196280, partial [marine sediment metagenome]
MANLDQAINIRGLKRFAIDRFPAAEIPEGIQASGKSVAVIGSGPAGLAAAHSLAMAGHHATVFEYADGVRMFAYCRRQTGCLMEVSDKFLGTKGRCNLLAHRIEGETNWRYEGRSCNRFDLEHAALFSSIRCGKPINNGLYMARSSMMAIMGRMVTYTGQTLTWEQCLNSTVDLTPEKYEWGPIATPPIAVPLPDRNFEVEWTIRSAPCSIGWLSQGVARVSST